MDRFIATVIVPLLLANPDVPGAFAAGFVNPTASGYSTDAIACWAIPPIWIVYERRAHLGCGCDSCVPPRNPQRLATTT